MWSMPRMSIVDLPSVADGGRQAHPSGHRRTELADGHAGEGFGLVLGEPDTVLLFHPYGELGERQRLQVGSGGTQGGVVVDPGDVVMHLAQRFDDEPADVVDHVVTLSPPRDRHSPGSGKKP